MVVMSDAALKSDGTKGPADVDMAADWDKVAAYAKSDVMKGIFADLKDSTLDVAEKPAGSVDYLSLLPRGGMRTFDWASLEEVVTSAEGREKLSEIKTAVDEIQDWIRENDKPVETIDWKYYHGELDDVVPGFVDKSKEVLEKVLDTTPDIDLSPQVELLQAQSASVNKAVEAYVAGVEEMKAEMDADLEAIKMETSVPDMTTEEVMTLYPELAAEIEKEIAEGNWDV